MLARQLIGFCLLLTTTSAVAAVEVMESTEKLSSQSSRSLRSATPFNLRTNALYMLTGRWNADLDIPLTERITMGPALQMNHGSRIEEVTVNDVRVSSYNSEMKSLGFGVRTNFYLTGNWNQTGLLIAPLLRLVRGQVIEDNEGHVKSDMFTATELGLILAYQVAWNSGFNLTLGGGWSVYSAFPSFWQDVNRGREIEVPNKSFPYLDASVGWIF